MSQERRRNDPHRPQPYANFRFRLKWNGSEVAGFSKVAGLSHGDEPAHRSGVSPARPRLVPGQSTYAVVALERGISHDVGFQRWMNQGLAPRIDGMPGAANDFRRDLSLELYDEAGTLVLTYTLFRCWPSAFTSAPELDATGNATLILSLVLQNEGWEISSGASGSGGPDFALPS